MAARTRHPIGAIERERKFLVTHAPAGLARFPHRLIEQGYLAVASGGGHSAEVRIRRMGTRSVLTVKRGRAPVRMEAEVRLPDTAARALWPLTRGRRVTKMRYRIPYRGATIELDVYRGKARGLIVAEVEFDSTAALERFLPPDWFDRDVTGRREFSNSHLAAAGWKRRTR